MCIYIYTCIHAWTIKSFASVAHLVIVSEHIGPNLAFAPCWAAALACRTSGCLRPIFNVLNVNIAFAGPLAQGMPDPGQLFPLPYFPSSSLLPIILIDVSMFILVPIFPLPYFPSGSARFGYPPLWRLPFAVEAWHLPHRVVVAEFAQTARLPRGYKAMVRSEQHRYYAELAR